MIQTVVFDTKPYDREALQNASAGLDIEWRFMDLRLTAETPGTPGTPGTDPGQSPFGAQVSE